MKTLAQLALVATLLTIPLAASAHDFDRGASARHHRVRVYAF
jgi:hypothetical protein